ncbi:MAG: hypothetical protein H7Z72_18975 [Bacteroidetes bacterium]|nr:hypothetical protein [Fibrella sp.]
MKLQQISTDLFGQLTEIGVQLTPDEYAQPLDLLFGVSVGKHYRHVLECYAIVITGYRTGHINYDRRVRQMALESNPRFAIDTMRQMAGQLRQCHSDRPLHFEASYSPDPVTDVSISTTFFRELLYNIEHAVHHSAIIRIGLETAFPHVTIPANFGVAYATVQYQRQTSTALTTA